MEVPKFGSVKIYLKFSNQTNSAPSNEVIFFILKNAITSANTIGARPNNTNRITGSDAMIVPHISSFLYTLPRLFFAVLCEIAIQGLSPRIIV